NEIIFLTNEEGRRFSNSELAIRTLDLLVRYQLLPDQQFHILHPAYDCVILLDDDGIFMTWKRAAAWLEDALLLFHRHFMAYEYDTYTETMKHRMQWPHIKILDIQFAKLGREITLTGNIPDYEPTLSTRFTGCDVRLW